ncbi:hypothetical protein JAAARDRAFT_553550 [Jaapia argillacea MUCL 33604]|uniref:Uncharacterized protein n=1 Tax=Jaapia argillacea MUCL 33604 TaxID=933084 RepID=A0A067Q0T3_9AGAM|nr:hypothetical protein JAAARDRAFT_553550 [Jaapia argillacea MUCL 33604]
MSVCKPIITISGTTGVGKSKLAIQLALALAKSDSANCSGARIINADSMQVYAGMDVITNKVPLHEQQGVDHLLMGFKQPGEQYVVGQWVHDAMKAIDETHARNQIPIVVGGTAYWIHHLIFPNRLSSTVDSQPSYSPPPSPSPSKVPLPSEKLSEALESLPPNLLHLFNNLPSDIPSSAAEAIAMHNLLVGLDPVVGTRWHWRDTRKVFRCLNIIKETGKRTSDIWEEQSNVGFKPRYRTLCFWLYADLPSLYPRLDARVDDMIKQGLLDEIRELKRIATSSPRPGVATTVVQDQGQDADDYTPDYTLGIYQSIGYKEFHTYLTSPDPTQKSFDEAVQQMKFSTRKYAKRQVSWMRNKMLPAVYAANAGTDRVEMNGERDGNVERESERIEFFLLDATQLQEKWDSDVRDVAEQITHDFLHERQPPDPLSLSEAARTMLTIKDRPTDPMAVLTARHQITCPICTSNPDEPFMVEEGSQWEAHRQSRVHRMLAAKQKGEPWGRPTISRKARRLAYQQQRAENGGEGEGSVRSLAAFLP